MSKMGFVAPFESTRYIAALERDVLVNIPIRVAVNLDIENKRVDAALKPLNSNEYHKVLQWTTLPYTTKHDILSMKPASEDSNAKIIRPRPSKSVSLIFSVHKGGFKHIFRLKLK
jgi:hypothetical protein